MKKSTYILIAILVGLAIWFYQRYYVAPSMNFNDIKVNDLHGNPVLLTSDKPTVVSFYETWCPPCQQEIQWMNEAYSSMKEEFNFIVVSSEKVENLVPVKNAYNLPIYQLSTSRKDYGVHSIPTVFIFDASGKLVHNHVGLIDFRDKTNITKHLQ